MAAAPELLWQALKAIDNSRIDDYDEWLELLAAVKAASGGNESFFETVVMPWALSYTKNTPEIVRIKWESIHDSSLGAGYVDRVARRWGYRGPPLASDFATSRQKRNMNGSRHHSHYIGYRQSRL